MCVNKILFAAVVSFSGMCFASDQITSLPGLKNLPDKEYSGYTCAGKHDKLFYWFVASHKPNAPIIIWSNGGPGYSSLYGFFNETGPYSVTSTLTLKKRANAWSDFANYLVIDQPADVGLSLLKRNQLPKTRQQGVDQYYNALYSFLKNHPRYAHSPIILAGESYAGTYLPMLATKILKENKKTDLKINLKSIILMSPWISPNIQQSMDSTYAYEHGLITFQKKLQIDAIYQHCKLLIQEHKETQANKICGEINSRIQSSAEIKDMANTSYLHFQSNALLDKYLNQKKVLAAIHAIDAEKFACWSNQVNKKYNGAIQESVEPLYNQLLSAHIDIVIFSGLNDAKDTNFLGIEKLIGTLAWPKRNDYLLAKTAAIKSIGYLKSGGGLTWVTVLNAGHMIPLDQPKVSKVVKSFIKTQS
ncbi:MAG: peptidase S10 [Gammaproteobacteria bacterium]|nr:peptidase S10 [Gammaproteobacteria bacterium]